MKPNLPTMAALAASLVLAAPAAAQDADMVIWGGPIHTADDARPAAEAVAVDEGRIVHVGDRAGAQALVGPQTQVIDLRGAALYPGFTDAHAHLNGIGARELTLNLEGAASIAEAMARLSEWAAAHPDGPIAGRGWIETHWPEGRFLTRQDLDAAAPGRIVLLGRSDGHALAASSAALEAAGITGDTPAPAGGDILKDAQGRPTGMLIDAAMALVDGLRPADTPQMREAVYRAGFETYAAYGWTGIHFMSAPLADNDLTIVVDGELVSKPYIDITLDVMAKFGVTVENRDYQEFLIRGQQTYRSPGRIMVEGDASSASYFLAAGAIAGGTVRVHGIGTASVQGDVKFADVLAQMGAKVTYSDYWIEVTKGELNGVDVDLNHIPDAAMTIATTALFAKGPTAIRNVYNWRVKETDRLHAMATELRKLGAEVEEGTDYIIIQPLSTLRAAEIETYDDHRIAMCFSLTAFGNAPITILDPGCTAKTFPTYFATFRSITTDASVD